MLKVVYEADQNLQFYFPNSEGNLPSHDSISMWNSYIKNRFWANTLSKIQQNQLLASFQQKSSPFSDIVLNLIQLRPFPGHFYTEALLRALNTQERLGTWGSEGVEIKQFMICNIFKTLQISTKGL